MYTYKDIHTYGGMMVHTYIHTEVERYPHTNMYYSKEVCVHTHIEDIT